MNPLKENNLSLAVNTPNDSAASTTFYHCVHKKREISQILNHIKHKDSECFICLESIHKNKVCIFNCKHLMHVECYINCIKKNLNKKNRCPVCRANIESIEIYENSEDLINKEGYACIDDKCNQDREKTKNNNRLPINFFLEEYINRQEDENDFYSSDYFDYSSEGSDTEFLHLEEEHH